MIKYFCTLVAKFFQKRISCVGYGTQHSFTFHAMRWNLAWASSLQAKGLVVQRSLTAHKEQGDGMNFQEFVSFLL
jgi:hypothetical protein